MFQRCPSLSASLGQQTPPCTAEALRCHPGLCHATQCISKRVHFAPDVHPLQTRGPIATSLAISLILLSLAQNLTIPNQTLGASHTILPRTLAVTKWRMATNTMKASQVAWCAGTTYATGGFLCATCLAPIQHAAPPPVVLASTSKTSPSNKRSTKKRCLAKTC